MMLNQKSFAPAVLFAFIAMLSIAMPARAGDPWAQIGPHGAPGRPPGLAAGVERRLNLLPALPGAQTQAAVDADALIGANHDGPGLAAGLVLNDGLYFSHGYGYR